MAAQRLDCFRLHEAGFAGFARAIRPNKDGLLRGERIDVVVRAKLKSRVLWVAIDSHPAGRASQSRGELNQVPAWDMVNR